MAEIASLARRRRQQTAGGGLESRWPLATTLAKELAVAARF
jgi:hypothetical protein